jgi:hypothetical protein
MARARADMVAVMKTLALLVGLAVFSATAAAAQDKAASPVVVELFTSQGCSSCPPADALLGTFAGRDDIIALTFNVDYWDYIGWKDTLADPDFAERQRGYVAAMGARRVYTPQMVIDGSVDVVGSDRSGLLRAIAEQAATPPALPVRLTRESGKVVLRIGDGQVARGATIWLMQYDNRQDVAIGRGENGGRTITYSNVVRELRKIGEWMGETVELTLGDGGGHDGCVVLVQVGSHGPVIGVARLRIVPAS